MKDESYLQFSLHEPAMLRQLPWILGVTNAVMSLPIAVVEVAIAIRGPSDGMDPLLFLVFLLDFPASLVPSAWTSLLSDYCRPFDDSNVAFALVYWSLSLITGFAWYYLIGCGLRRLLRRVPHRHADTSRGFPVIERRNTRGKF